MTRSKLGARHWSESRLDGIGEIIVRQDENNIDRDSLIRSKLNFNLFSPGSGLAPGSRLHARLVQLAHDRRPLSGGRASVCVCVVTKPPTRLPLQRLLARCNHPKSIQMLDLVLSSSSSF